jgi:hypothetical protein
MAFTTVPFTGQQAPCGRIVDGESFRDQDDEVVVTQAWDFACGCRRVRHEYHDGTVSRRDVHHDGTVLVDELLSQE